MASDYMVAVAPIQNDGRYLIDETLTERLKTNNVETCISYYPDRPDLDFQFIQICFPSLKKWTVILCNSEYVSVDCVRNIRNSVTRDLPDVTVVVKAGGNLGEALRYVEPADVALILNVFLFTGEDRECIVPHALRKLKLTGSLICFVDVEADLKRRVYRELNHTDPPLEWDPIQFFSKFKLRATFCPIFDQQVLVPELSDLQIRQLINSEVPDIVRGNMGISRFREILASAYPEQICTYNFCCYRLTRT